MIIDVHAHLFHKDFDHDREKVLQRAKNAGVSTIINNGLNPVTNRDTLRLKEQHGCEAALGIYPWDAVNLSEKEIQQELNWIKRQDCIALGEVGLDYVFPEGVDQERAKAEQVETFKAFIDLGKTLKKPLIIHSRNAEEDVTKLLSERNAYNPVLHCFTGKRKTWRKAAGHGVYFSIPPVAKRATQFQELIRDVPVHQLFVETDSPYLSHKKQDRNEPKNAAVSIEVIADVKGLDPTEVQNQLLMNYQRVFT